MLPASRSGKTSTLAWPASGLPGALLAATSGTMAASTCSSPSTQRRVGRRRPGRLVGQLTLAADLEVALGEGVAAGGDEIGFDEDGLGEALPGQDPGRLLDPLVVALGKHDAPRLGPGPVPDPGEDGVGLRRRVGCGGQSGHSIPSSSAASTSTSAARRYWA